MKIISFIYKKTVIMKILTHLNMYEDRENQRAPPVPTQKYDERVKIVSYVNDWPGYDELDLDF